MNEVELSVLNKIEKNVKLAYQYRQAYPGKVWVMYGDIGGYYWYSIARKFKTFVDIVELNLDRRTCYNHPTFNIGCGHLELRTASEANENFERYWKNEHSAYRYTVLRLAESYLEKCNNLDFVERCTACASEPVDYCDACENNHLVLKAPLAKPSQEVIEYKQEILDNYCSNINEVNVVKFDHRAADVFNHLPFNFHLEDNDEVGANNALLQKTVIQHKKKQKEKDAERIKKLQENSKLRDVATATKALVIGLGMSKQEAEILADKLLKEK